jgi:hypothetical protein
MYMYTVNMIGASIRLFEEQVENKKNNRIVGVVLLLIIIAQN